MAKSPPNIAALKARYQIPQAEETLAFEGETYTIRLPRNFREYQSLTGQTATLQNAVKTIPPLQQYQRLSEEELGAAALVKAAVVDVWPDSDLLEMADTWGGFVMRLADAIGTRYLPIINGEMEAVELQRALLKDDWLKRAYLTIASEDMHKRFSLWTEADYAEARVYLAKRLQEKLETDEKAKEGEDGATSADDTPQ